MLDILKLFFGKSKKRNQKSASIPSENVKLKKESINFYFAKELTYCEHVKKEAHPIVMKHLCHKVNLNKTGNKLTAQEKKDLGINTRLSITHELVDVLTTSGLAQPDPKEILSSIYLKATFAKIHDESLSKYREIGVKHYQLSGCNDERECKWCKSMDGKKMPISQDINTLIKENCNCESHCRLRSTAVF